MKSKIFFIVLVIGFFFAGCDTGSHNEEYTFAETNVQIYNLDGSPYTGNGTLKIMYELDENKLADVGIVTNGKFTLNLPKQLAEDALIDWSGADIKKEPADVKLVRCYSFKLYNDDGTFQGDIQYAVKTYRGGLELTKSEINYFYTNHNVKITGTDNFVWEGIGGISEFNVELEPGWNRLHSHGYYDDETKTRYNWLDKDYQLISPDIKWVMY
jgi:hypothetical protein